MKKTLFLALFAFLFTMANAQLKFFTDGGKTEVKQGKVGMKDLMVRVPIPAGLNTFDKARLYIWLTPNSSVSSLDVYYYTLEKEVFLNKKTVDIILKNPDGSSTFEYSSVAGSFMEIDHPAKDPTRSEQVFQLSFELQGMKFEKYTFDNGNKEPYYSFAKLSKYYNIFPFDYGKAESDYFSQSKICSIKKKYDINVDLAAPFGETDGIRAILYTQAQGDYNGGTAMFDIVTHPVSEMSLEETKTDIMNYLIASSSARLTKKLTEAKKNYNMEIFYPCYSKKNGKSGSSEVDKMVDEMCANPVSWQAKKVGNLDGFILDFPFVHSRHCKYGDDYKTAMGVDHAHKKHKLVVFVGEHKGKIFVGKGVNLDGPPTTPEITKFFNDVIASFKVY